MKRLVPEVQLIDEDAYSDWTQVADVLPSDLRDILMSGKSVDAD